MYFLYPASVRQPHLSLASLPNIQNITMSGASYIAQIIADLGVTVVFGLVGIPIIEVADALQAQNVRFIGFRNEQAASYAASAYGYLTGKPGVLLIVGGPGLVHGLAGAFNSASNHWPLMVLAGSIDRDARYKGGFQELDQVGMVERLTKFAATPMSLGLLEYLLVKAYRLANSDQPGCTYVDLPGDLIQTNEVPQHALQAPISFSKVRSGADPGRVAEVAAVLRSAKFPLAVVGKGAADASPQVRQFIEQCKIGFIPTPMGKGVVPDSSHLNLSSARSMALKRADVVLLLGARLNWILHLGDLHKFNSNTKFIQVNHSADVIGDNYINMADTKLGLVGDISLVVPQLESALAHYTAPAISQELVEKCRTNAKLLAAKENTMTKQLNYYVSYKAIRELLDPSTILVVEGANTMDVARLSFPIEQPKKKLDAGTNATMGVGLGYAIAAKVAHPHTPVVAIEGDSAFGFSAMEVETAVRYGLDLTIIVMNNSGIYHGLEQQDHHNISPIELSKGTRYDLLGRSLGAQGYHVTSVEELKHAVKASLSSGKCSVINVVIEPGKQRKVAFGWQRTKL